MNPDNIIEGQLTRTLNNQAKFDSFTGKRYQDNMLNIADNDFKYFGKIKSKFYSKTVGTCFTQMTANKEMKVLGEVAVAVMIKEYKQLDNL